MSTDPAKYVAWGFLRDKDVEGVRECAPGEADAIKSALAQLRAFEASCQGCMHVVQEGAEYRREISDLARANASGTILAASAVMRVLFGLNRRVVNFASLVCVFVQHAQIAVERECGKESAQAHAFRALDRDLYDQRRGYRFVKRLRNYTQHYELPPAEVDFRAWLDSPAGARKLQSVTSIRFAVQQLRDSGFDWPSQLRQDFDSRSATWEVAEVMEDAEFAVVHLDALRAAFQVHALRRAAVAVGSLEREIVPPGGQLVLITADREKPTHAPSISILPTYVREVIDLYADVEPWRP